MSRRNNKDNAAALAALGRLLRHETVGVGIPCELFGIGSCVPIPNDLIYAYVIDDMVFFEINSSIETKQGS
jgi:hypothetical protein